MAVGRGREQELRRLARTALKQSAALHYSPPHNKAVHYSAATRTTLNHTRFLLGQRYSTTYTHANPSYASTSAVHGTVCEEITASRRAPIPTRISWRWMVSWRQRMPCPSGRSSPPESHPWTPHSRVLNRGGTWHLQAPALAAARFSGTLRGNIRGLRLLLQVRPHGGRAHQRMLDPAAPLVAEDHSVTTRRSRCPC